jgi:hypothetical protein
LAQKPPQWARASSFTRFLDHTQRRTTVRKTPLDEWLARRLLPDNNITFTTDRLPCPRWDSNPQSKQASGHRPTQTMRPLGPAFYYFSHTNFESMKWSLLQWLGNKAEVVVTKLIVSCGTNRRDRSKIRRISVNEIGPTIAIRRTFPAITVYIIYPCADFYTASVAYFTAKSVAWTTHRRIVGYFPSIVLCNRGTGNAMQ